MGTLKEIDDEIFNIEHVYPYKNIDMVDITGENIFKEVKDNVTVGLKSLGNLGIKIGKFINNRKTYALEFVKSLGPKVHRAFIDLKDELISKPKSRKDILILDNNNRLILPASKRKDIIKVVKMINGDTGPKSKKWKKLEANMKRKKL